jgi:hypothetical protein
MAAPARTYTWDHVLSTTADKIHKSGAIQDAISNSNPTFKELMEKGKIKKKVVGGDQIAVNLMYEQNSTIDSYSGYDQIDVSPQDGITRAYVPWAQYAGAVSISGIQKFKNMGKEQIADLLKEKIRQTTAGWSERLNKDLWEGDSDNFTASHPFTGNSGKNIISIPLYIQALSAATAAHDYDIGGIDQSTYTWWKNQIVDGVGATTDILLKQKMSNAYNLCSQGPGGSPNLIMMDQVTYEVYEMSMQNQIRYSYTDKASAGFESLHFKGAKVMWDGYVPDYELGTNGVLATGSALTNGSIVFINTDTMSLYVGKDHDWKPRGFMTPVDQDASTSLYLCYLQLVCDNRRKNGAIFDVPTSVTAS